MNTNTAPDLDQLFAIAGGTITGRRHLGKGSLLVGRNNQDAHGWCSSNRLVAAVVCDGCSSGRASELGAQVGARLVLRALERAFDVEPPAEGGTASSFAATLEGVRRDVLDRLGVFAWELGDGALRDMLLFTVVGVVVTPAQTAVFSIGDGVYAINGDLRRIGPFPDNAPPYLAYALLDEMPVVAGSEPRVTIEECLPTDEVEALMIGTDGVLELAAAEGEPFPGREGRVGPLARLWSEERYFSNADALRRELAVLNSQSVVFDPESEILRWSGGLLQDDTTLVVLKRRSEQGNHEASS